MRHRPASCREWPQSAQATAGSAHHPGGSFPSAVRATPAAMDIFSILGVVVALVGVLGGMVLEGGHPGELLQVTAFMIVIVGSLGATMVATLPSDLPHAIRALRRWALPTKYDFHGLMEKILELANLARREGLLALESY